VNIKRCREGKEPESASASNENCYKEHWQKPPSLDRDWNKTVPAVHGSIQPWISELAKQNDSRSSFNELMDTPLDFSNFLINRLKVDTLTSKLLAGPTYELMKGSCKSLVELEYYLEEVFKATTNQLDWVNPEVQQYPHNLLKPLPLIPNNRGRRVIPFEHFINNDLEYLRGGASSRKYTTSIMKTKAADYGHIKWIEDLVPRTIWIEEPIGYEKHALWGNKDKRNRLMRIDELHKFSDGTLTDVRTALDDRLKGIRMQHLSQLIWRKSDKDRAMAMIQAIDKMLKTRRIMRSLERSILTDLRDTPTKPGRMTKPYSSHCFIANCFNVGNIKMEVKVPGSSSHKFITTCLYPTIKYKDIIFQDFCYSDESISYQVIKSRKVHVEAIALSNSIQTPCTILLRLASAAIFTKMGVLQIGTRAMVIDNKVETLTITTFSFSQESPPCRYISVPLHFPELTMSSPDHSISNNEDAFSSNIPDYVSTISDYSLASSGKTYSNALNKSTGKIPPEFSPFYNMKDIQACRDFFPSEEISPKDTETSVSPSSLVGSSSPIRSTISPLDNPFDESIFTKLDNSLWITPRPLGEEPVPEEPNESDTYLWK
nr:hypothetical protein [Tanacetum cinerariifolium]